MSRVDYERILTEHGIDGLRVLELRNQDRITKGVVAIILWLTFFTVAMLLCVRPRMERNAAQKAEIAEMKSGVPDIVLIIDGCTTVAYDRHEAHIGVDKECVDNRNKK